MTEKERYFNLCLISIFMIFVIFVIPLIIQFTLFGNILGSYIFISIVLSFCWIILIIIYLMEDKK